MLTHHDPSLHYWRHEIKIFHVMLLQDFKFSDSETVRRKVLVSDKAFSPSRLRETNVEKLPSYSNTIVKKCSASFFSIETTKTKLFWKQMSRPVSKQKLGRTKIRVYKKHGYTAISQCQNLPLPWRHFPCRWPWWTLSWLRALRAGRTPPSGRPSSGPGWARRSSSC